MRRMITAFGNLKFRNKMMLSMLLVALIPMLVFSMVIGTVVVENVSKQAGKLTLQMVEQTSESLDVYISTIEKLMGIVIREGTISSISDPAQYEMLNHAANTILNAYPEIVGITIAYGDDTYFGAGMTRISRDLFADEAWYRYAISLDGQLGILGNAVGRNVVGNTSTSSDAIFSLVKAFDSPEDHVPEGVVLVDIRHDMIEQLVNRVSIGENGFLYVVDDNDIVYTPASDVVYRIDPDSYSNPGVDTTTLMVENQEYFIANHYSDYSGWRVVGVVLQSEFSKSIHSLYQALAICLVVCLALMLVVSISVSSSVTRPISKLSRLMAKAEEGDFSVRFSAIYQDEIGVLGDAFNHMLEHITELIYELYEEKQIRLEAQLKSLQEQIKPHFLYNTLDTISWMARAQGAMDVVHLVDALTSMFRVGLSSGRDYITLREEKSHVTNYLYIQKVRYQDRLRYAIDIPDAYDHFVVPKLILQPLVENSIYHGIKCKRSGGLIRITAQVVDSMLCLRVWDDGVGIPGEKLADIQKWKPSSAGEKPVGFGLSYIAERLRLTYGQEARIQLKSEEGIFTEITITLPVKEDETDV